MNIEEMLEPLILKISGHELDRLRDQFHQASVIDTGEIDENDVIYTIADENSLLSFAVDVTDIREVAPPEDENRILMQMACMAFDEFNKSTTDDRRRMLKLAIALALDQLINPKMPRLPGYRRFACVLKYRQLDRTAGAMFYAGHVKHSVV